MQIHVLLIEDKASDVRLTQEAFREANEAVQLHVAIDGIEAMSFLLQEGAYADAPRPALTLLDLNVPGLDGREVLVRIKNDDRLKNIPIVILTSSESEADVVNSYQSQANCYISKPVHFEEFHSLVRSISDFWLRKIKSPEPQPEALSGD
jgi:chemotaxis family two-component system response regulator Rcp1